MHAFDDADRDALIGPTKAFDPDHASNPSQYALQNHLALEVVAHLQRAGLDFQFQGGTSLHVKLGDRVRFSIDVDLRASDPQALHDALRAFTKAFPRSEIVLEEPPGELRIDGVRHTLAFNRLYNQQARQPLRIHVEVVESEEPQAGAEPLRLKADGHEWPVDVAAPSLETFAGQKYAVLGPRTIGKPVGPNETHAHMNQGVCKQLFDLHQLLLSDLDGRAVAEAYEREVAEANRLRGTDHDIKAAADDARDLLGTLRMPRGRDSPYQVGLWAGFDDSRRWIARQARQDWTSEEYRVTGGVLSRLGTGLVDGDVDWPRIARPVREQTVPEEVLSRIDAAEGEPWFDAEAFQGSARLAWAWAPSKYW